MHSRVCQSLTIIVFNAPFLTVRRVIETLELTVKTFQAFAVVLVRHMTAATAAIRACRPVHA